jgi:RimJ/RimL family protein N-acetyltransferase
VIIRRATEVDFDAIWPIFQQIVSAGDSYAYPSDTNQTQAQHLWMTVPAATYVAEIQGQILGTYYIKTNQQGPGAHVCNCGYMVAPAARGQGLATHKP